MKSFVIQFKKLSDKYPLWSSYTCFAYAITGKKFTRPTLAKYFNKLVEKDDYARSERKQIISFLYTLMNHPEDKDFQGVNGSQRGEKREKVEMDVLE